MAVPRNSAFGNHAKAGRAVFLSGHVFCSGSPEKKSATFRRETGFLISAMNHEEHDELWHLLGKARQPKPAPFFAANVMRAVRAEAEPKPGFIAWLRAKWYVPATAGACAAVLAFLALRPAVIPVTGADPLEEIAMAAATTPDTLPSLDSLLASENNSIWLAGDPSSLY